MSVSTWKLHPSLNSCVFCIPAYIRDVEHAKQTQLEETRAAEAQASGDWQVEGLVGMMEKINQPDQLPMYYSGGLRILTRSLNNSK